MHFLQRTQTLQNCRIANVLHKMASACWPRRSHVRVLPGAGTLISFETCHTSQPALCPFLPDETGPQCHLGQSALLVAIPVWDLPACCTSMKMKFWRHGRPMAGDMKMYYSGCICRRLKNVDLLHNRAGKRAHCNVVNRISKGVLLKFNIKLAGK